MKMWWKEFSLLLFSVISQVSSFDEEWWVKFGLEDSQMASTEFRLEAWLSTALRSRNTPEISSPTIFHCAIFKQNSFNLMVKTVSFVFTSILLSFWHTACCRTKNFVKASLRSYFTVYRLWNKWCHFVSRCRQKNSFQLKFYLLSSYSFPGWTSHKRTLFQLSRRRNQNFAGTRR